jgi:hypothetical protein
MSKAAFTVTSDPTTRELVRRVIAANDGMERDRRAMLKGQGRRFVSFAQDEAPKRTGVFASKIFYRTYAQGDTEELRVFTPQPLGGWITKGTPPHVIRPRGPGYPLRFFWPKVGREVRFMYVNHPGTKPNRFIGRAYRRWLPGARADLRLIAQNWSRTIQGAAVSPKDLSA